jgi:hypothetical protein
MFKIPTKSELAKVGQVNMTNCPTKMKGSTYDIKLAFHRPRMVTKWAWVEVVVGRPCECDRRTRMQTYIDIETYIQET